MKIVRVFPRRTTATPTDEMAFVGDPPPPAFRPEADEVHISCTFTWDRVEAERLVRAWSIHYPGKVRLGGPALGDRGGDFLPGRYVREGMVITSRGCPNACKHCVVPAREGKLRELPIRAGWDVLDNNLLACSRGHVEAVLDMLEGQRHRAKFSGGLEARRVTDWFVERLKRMRLERVFTAYDEPADREDVRRAVGMLLDAGLSRSQVSCYVLVGQDGDSGDWATARCEWIKGLGATPFAMYFLGPLDRPDRIPQAWRDFRRAWCRPAAIWRKDKAKV